MAVDYTWTFEISFLVFLAVVFVSQSGASLVRSLIPMPLLFGAIFIAGFALGIFPRDMIMSSNMIAVGTIAFNVLVIHSGTMIDLKMLRVQGRSAGICLIATLVVVAVVGFGLAPVIGRDLALLAPGAILGGGASCAIASRWVLNKNPAVSVFPWMIFMFQGLFSVPVVTFALKKESAALLSGLRSGKMQPPAGPPPVAAPRGLVQKIPKNIKTTAYYLGGIMLVAVANRLLHTYVLIPIGIHININVTALLFGVLLGQLGLLEKGPLNQSDSYGLLLLGLMGLMANTMANNELGNILRLLPPLLVAFVVATLVLVLCGIFLAKAWGMRPARGVALTMNSMMGFPVNGMLIQNASAAGQSDAEQNFLRAQLGPVLGVGTMLISNAVSVFIVSIMVGLV